MNELDSLKQQLTGRGLPPEYISRVMLELSDHAEDLSRAESHATLIADVAALADSFESHLRPFRGRPPVFQFTAVPLAMLCFMSMICLQAGGLFGSLTSYTSPSFAALLSAGLFFIKYCAAPAIATVFCLITRRCGLAPVWAALPATLMAIAGLAMIEVAPPLSGPGSGIIKVAFGLDAGPSGIVPAISDFNTVRFLLPLIIFAVFFVLERRRLPHRSRLI